MDTIYLLRNNGKEDHYELVGTRESLNEIFSEKSVCVEYPGSKKTVSIVFRESDNPAVELKDKISQGKRSEISELFGFFIIAGLTIYGAVSLLHKIVGFLG